jgi:protein gp37
MAENSKIEWTDHTFNPWIGCTKVHAGCTHCYAEAMMGHRYGKAKWGVDGTRNRTSEAYWRKPLQWNRAAEKTGRPALVFCASLADVFEDREDLVEHRRDLFAMVDQTPHLIWLMLTKRPENIHSMWPKQLPDDGGCGHVRRNVWIGTSPCNQETADKSIRELIKCSDLCGGLFLSCEPLLGEIDLNLPWIRHPDGTVEKTSAIDWVIVGGESGHDARPMNPNWIGGIGRQCIEAGVPFFFKQWGEWAPWKEDEGPAPNGRPCGFWSYADHWYDSDVPNTHRASMVRVGKVAAGRLVDGREWSEFPAAFKREASQPIGRGA